MLSIPVLLPVPVGRISMLINSLFSLLQHRRRVHQSHKDRWGGDRWVGDPGGHGQVRDLGAGGSQLPLGD